MRVTADINRFLEAVAWFRQRVPMTDAEYAALEALAKVKAFRVAGVAQLDLVREVFEAVDRAVEGGETLRDFKERVGAKLEAAWGGTVANPGARIETVFRTNVQVAYSRGHFEQLTKPAVLKSRPFWKFSARLDTRTSETCRPLNGKVFPADHAFWQSQYPPLHHRCRSIVIALTPAAAERIGVTEDIPTVHVGEGFGNPLQDWEPDLRQVPTPLRRVYNTKAKDEE